MRGPWRALLALALHVCFFALPLCVVVGLVLVSAVTFRYSTGGGARAGLAAVFVAVLLGVGFRAILRPRVRAMGVAVDRSSQPRLWKLIETTLPTVNAPVPDEVRITIEPRVTVREDAMLLGLWRRSRWLEIGLPVLAGLTVSELRAVIGHEAARLDGGVNGTARRVSRSIEHSLSTMVGGPTRWLFGGYAKLYAPLVPHRDIELAAMTAPVRVAGKRVTVTALHKMTAIELAWPEYAEQYLSMAIATERTPEVLSGFRAFLEHPRRKPELAERAKHTIAQDNRLGRMPSLRERIDAVKRAPDSDPERDDHPAVALLRNPKKTVPELENQLTVDGLGPRTPWPELAKKAGALRVAEQAGLLSFAVAESGVGQPAIGAVLAAIHRGQASELINPALNPGLDPDRLDEAVVDTMTELLGAAVVDALVGTGRAHHELDWGGPSTVRLTNGRALDPDRLVRPAVADPRLIPGLHRALVDLGVPLEHARPPADESEPEFAGLVSSVRLAGCRYELLVTDRGLLLVPSSATPLRHVLAGAFGWLRQAEDERLAELAATPIERSRADTDTRWIDSRDVASAQLRTGQHEWVLRLELYLDDQAVSTVESSDIDNQDDEVATVVLSSTRESVERGDPYTGLGELMGARMDSDRPAEEGTFTDDDVALPDDLDELDDLPPKRVMPHP